jgi:hypothetical protein
MERMGQGTLGLTLGMRPRLLRNLFYLQRQDEQEDAEDDRALL